MITRRGVVSGLIGLLAAPAIIRTPGLLMPVHRIIIPTAEIWRPGDPIFRWKHENLAGGGYLIRLEEWKGAWVASGPYRQWPLTMENLPIKPVSRHDDPRALADDMAELIG